MRRGGDDDAEIGKEGWELALKKPDSEGKGGEMG
jgi:hypothetical protein